jgi:zinc finger protein
MAEQEQQLAPAEAEAVAVPEGAAEDGLDYDVWNGVDEMTSLCMACGATGMTRLMLHKIPHFRELIIASFCCDACGERNNEVTFGGEIQPLGSICTLKVTNPKDLDRQLIKSDTATVTIPELEFEIPAKTQKGEITTIEGILKRAADNLALYQDERMSQLPEVGAAVAQVIAGLIQVSGCDSGRSSGCDNGRRVSGCDSGRSSGWV